MFRKPFQTPLLKNTEEPVDMDETLEPQAKRIRLSSDNKNDVKTIRPRLVFKTPGLSLAPRRPLVGVENPAVTARGSHGSSEKNYNVLWRKYTTKKHKTWDGDGVLKVASGYAHLRDVSGHDMGKIPCDSLFLPGSQLSIGGKEVEVDSIIPKEGHLDGLPLVKPCIIKTSPEPKHFHLSNRKLKNLNATTTPESVRRERPLNLAAPRSAATQAMFKNPMLASTMLLKQESKEPRPRHEPTAAQALVMKRPKSVPQARQVVDIVVDPLLTKHLRDHQREGVKFMYECVMGMREFDGQGTILADEMGLGKTLQTIALLWTLLKQNPICEGLRESPPIVRKALIVCPVTLINNWRKEFRKWLGGDRLGVYVFDDSKKRITDFTEGKAYPVGIIGYEKLRTVAEDLKKGHGIDIVIADEGHRLKTAKNKSAQAIRSLNTLKRVILSGTPIQNDLSEFFMMVDLVNPDLLGSFKKFTRDFAIPIEKSRQPSASSKELEKGKAKSEELASLTSMFILRRTTDILLTYLPSKTEYVLLCRPTAAQASAYRHLLACPAFRWGLGNSENTLQLITLLKKLCNSPSLLNGKTLSGPSTSMTPLTAALLESVPSHLLRTNAGSTKLRVLDQLMHTLRTTTSEKMILVSNYTTTLDLLQSLLTSLSYPHLRLDGSTPSSKRQELVDRFNHSPASECFAFLLSAKSGGVGLNLIGASRLVLFDLDWNPATDLQATARIHRDGQKRPCVIYRFLMAGGLDEKIWQRQTTKLGLASNVLDQNGGTSNFTKEELKDLFRLDEGLSCQSHDLLGCGCQGRGPPTAPGFCKGRMGVHDSDDDDTKEDYMPDFPHLVQAKGLDMEQQERKLKEKARDLENQKDSPRVDSLMTYSHIDTSKFSLEDDNDLEALINDQVLLNVLKDEGNRVSFIFAKTSG